MTGALDLAGEMALAAGAVAGLAARANLAGFGDVAAQCVNIFIVEAFAFGAELDITHPAARATPVKAAVIPITVIAAEAASAII